MGDDSRLRAVAGLAQRMAAAQALHEAALAAAEGARRALGGACAALSVWEPDRGRLRVLANAGVLAPGRERFPADESYAAPDFPASPGRPRPGPGPRVVIPLLLDGRPWGELSVAREAGAEEFGPAAGDFAAVLGSVIGAGLVSHERLAEARRLAFTDPLTGLANRRAVDLRLAEALGRHRATGVVVSLVVCDVNGLKQVNDTFGHATGDRLLERFGTLLAGCAATVPGALAARLGGDEFCLLAVDADAADVERAAGEVCRRAAELDLGDGVACGIASTGGAIGPLRSARRLFRLADAAQYEAKATRSREPVVAGRPGAGDAAVALADDTAPAGGDRRALRSRKPR
ncbi:GGDEF domain-containing protein [Streptomyces sp. RFCAC02]|uniref:GGDEF domain-containing protein n=1 Tax=Streptomyces sp. RFCAC02 TaxID=2499143 RepID=UPI001021149E|nr:GGDEF domain-containing protein [Streptomyces sp. RFCAC02]